MKPRDPLAARLHAIRSPLFCWTDRSAVLPRVSPACRPNGVRHQQQAALLRANGIDLVARP